MAHAFTLHKPATFFFTSNRFLPSPHQVSIILAVTRVVDEIVLQFSSSFPQGLSLISKERFHKLIIVLRKTIIIEVNFALPADKTGH